MRRFVCWNKQDVVDVMNPDADYTPDYIFNAVHVPIDIVKKFGHLSSEESISFSPEELLSDLENKQIKHLVVPILGDSGTGKTHLVHWLHSNLQKEDIFQEVLLIPKAGVNLKSIIELILRGRDGEVFDNYRERLRKAGQQISPDSGRQLLLDKLAQVITFQDTSYYERKLEGTIDSELLEYSKQRLPDLLYDTHFRKGHWLKEGGVIEQLYEVAFGSKGARERLGERRKLSDDDMPIKVFDFAAAGADAKSFVAELMGTPDLVDVCVKLLNVALDDAIKEILMLGQDLTVLMQDVRKEVFREGVTLVLLIEDFAKLQGIDTAVLEAVIQQSTEENQLCPIKVVFACTDGYYRNIPATFRTRIPYTVWVEFEGRDFPYDRMVAYYMNAARIGAVALKESYSNFIKSRTGSNWRVQNACTNCIFLNECHEAFGEVDGIGLYPFNKTAPKAMYKRVSNGIPTPREFILRVLKEVPYRYHQHILEGEFPNRNLLQKYGNRYQRLKPNEVSAITEKYRSLIGDKLLTLIEFWSDASRKLKSGIARAFDVPDFDDPQKGDIEQEIVVQEQLPIIEPSIETFNFPISFERLTDWMNGSLLDQVTKRECRRLVYNSIINYIDWNALGIYKNVITNEQGKRSFKEDKIHFIAKSDQSIPDEKISLVLPISGDDRVLTTMALQGLILFDHYKNWDFPDGSQYFIALSECLPVWSNTILQQATNHSDKVKDWVPLYNILQWMYFFGRLCGNLSHGASIPDLWDKLNEPVEFKYLEARTSLFKGYIAAIAKPQSQLEDQLWKNALCSKGNVINLKYFDISQVIPLVEKVHKEKKPSYRAPDDASKYFENLHKLDAAYDTKFLEAIESEIKHYKELFEGLNSNIGGPEHIGELFKNIKDFFESVESEGITAALNNSTLDQLLSFVNQPTHKYETAYRNCSAIMEKSLAIDENFAELVSRIGRADYKFHLVELNKFTTDAMVCLQRVENYLLNDIERKKQANSGNLETIKTQIAQHLELLSTVDLSNTVL